MGIVCAMNGLDALITQGGVICMGLPSNSINHWYRHPSISITERVHAIKGKLLHNQVECWGLVDGTQFSLDASLEKTIVARHGQVHHVCTVTDKNIPKGPSVIQEVQRLNPSGSG